MLPVALSRVKWENSACANVACVALSTAMGEKKKPPATDPKGVSVRISPALRKRAKVYAAVNNISLMAVVDTAVEKYLDAQELKKRGA
jgi:hypothetical protein